jgi:hypothetical protein
LLSASNKHKLNARRVPAKRCWLRFTAFSKTTALFQDPIVY